MTETASQGTASPADGAKPDRVGFLHAPSTKVGWWAGVLSLAFIVLFVVASIPALAFRVPGFALVGVVSAVLSVAALTKGHDRSWLVWLGIGVAAFLLADLVKALLLDA